MERLNNTLVDRLDGIEMGDETYFTIDDIEASLTEIVADVAQLLSRSDIKQLIEGEGISDAKLDKIYKGALEFQLNNEMKLLGRYDKLIKMRALSFDDDFDELIYNKILKKIDVLDGIESIGEETFNNIIISLGLDPDNEELYEQGESDNDSVAVFYITKDDNYLFLQIDGDDEQIFVFN